MINLFFNCILILNIKTTCDTLTGVNERKLRWGYSNGDYAQASLWLLLTEQHIERKRSYTSSLPAFLTFNYYQASIHNLHKQETRLHYIISSRRTKSRKIGCTNRRRCWSDLALKAEYAAFSVSGILSASAAQLIALIALRDIFSYYRIPIRRKTTDLDRWRLDQCYWMDIFHACASNVKVPLHGGVKVKHWKKWANPIFLAVFRNFTLWIN